MMALEWSDVDLNKRQLCVARSEWKGHVNSPKGGRLRYVPLTKRLTEPYGKRVIYAAPGCSVRRTVSR
jgi:integrase